MSMVGRSKGLLYLQRTLACPPAFPRHEACASSNLIPSQVSNTATLSGSHVLGMLSFVRHCANSPTTKSEEPDFLKRIFFNMMKRYRLFVSELRKQRIIVDPDDPKAVLDYKNLMDGIRKKAGLMSGFDKLTIMIKQEAESAPDLKTFYKAFPKIKAHFGVTESFDGDRMMVEAVEKVEKKLGRVLVRGDKEGLALLQKEIDAINKELGIDPRKQKEMEAECELEFAKHELKCMKHEAEQAMEAHKKKRGLEDLQIDIRKLDHRTYL